MGFFKGLSEAKIGVCQLNSGGGVPVKTGEGVTQFKFEFYILKSLLTGWQLLLVWELEQNLKSSEQKRQVDIGKNVESPPKGFKPLH